MALSKEENKQIVENFRINEKDSGSPEVQIALLTREINLLNEHVKANKHDYSSQRGLMKKIGHRRNLLKYLEKKDIQRYRDCCDKLGLRRYERTT